MASTGHFDTLQKIYIAFYQRPGDPAGIRYWADRLAHAQGDSAAVIDAFAASTEAQALYGLVSHSALEDVIDAVYQALFRRPADAEGKAFYQAAFEQGILTVGNIVLAILHGAQGDDLTAIENKLAVAREFTRQVDGRDYHHAEFGNGWDAAYAYAGREGTAMARGMLAGVTADPATILDAAAIARILQGVKPEGSHTIINAPVGSAVISYVAGDEDDTIAIKVDGTGRNNVSVWVDAGAGDDVITVNNSGPVRVTVHAGTGNDTVILAQGMDSIATQDVLDGGEGFDTLVTAGGQVGAEDYAALARFVTGFERIAFTDRVELDAGQLQQFGEIAFAAGGSVVDVSDEQLLVAGGNLSAWAKDYREEGSRHDDVEASRPAAGTLNVVAQSAGSIIEAYGRQLNLTVMAAEDEAATWLQGDVARADIVLAGQSRAGPSDDGPIELASVMVITAGTVLSSLSGITVEGTGSARVYNYEGSALEQVDVSAMQATPPPDAGSPDMAGGLAYLSYNSRAETILLGDGVDQVKLWSSTVGSTDVVMGLGLVARSDMPDELDMERSDRLVLGGFNDVDGMFEIVDDDHVGTLMFQDALSLLAANNGPVVFHWQGDTFVFSGGGNGQVDDGDVLVRLVGELDLDILVASLGSNLDM